MPQIPYLLGRTPMYVPLATSSSFFGKAQKLCRAFRTWSASFPSLCSRIPRQLCYTFPLAPLIIAPIAVKTALPRAQSEPLIRAAVAEVCDIECAYDSLKEAELKAEELAL